MFRRNLESCKSKKRWIWGRNLDFVRKLAIVWKGSQLNRDRTQTNNGWKAYNTLYATMVFRVGMSFGNHHRVYCMGLTRAIFCILLNYSLSEFQSLWPIVGAMLI